MRNKLTKNGKIKKRLKVIKNLPNIFENIYLTKNNNDRF